MTKHKRPVATAIRPHGNESGFRWETRTTSRIGLWATLAAAAIGILLAIFQVQEWKVPTPIALALIVLLSLTILLAVSMIAYEVVRACRRFLEHRATSASWVSSEAPGFLDYEADGLRAATRFTKELMKLNRDTERVGRKMQRHAKGFSDVAAKSGKAKQRRANRAAKAIGRSAVFIEKRIELIDALGKDIFRNYQGLISMFSLGSDDERSAAMEFRDVLASTHAETRQAVSSVGGYRDSVRTLQAQNASRTVRIESERLGDALDGVVAALSRLEKLYATLLRQFDQKLGSTQMLRVSSA